ncbi:MAG: hypothetical protein JOY94_00185 [Methylobacteriaceae bacterium]|nr:hypothetical protein [Methylobacteriaceae bacterium]
MILKSTWIALADARRGEALALLDRGMFAGAYYLAGYAIECALKACIASEFQAHAIPARKFVNDIYTHDLKKLASIAGLTPKIDDRSSRDPSFGSNWEIVAEWSEDSRYVLMSEDEARALLEAVVDPRQGVFQWIRANW